MATKRQGNDCYEKADADEPVFTLRAQDMTAPVVVGVWIVFQFVADLICRQPVCSAAKLREAFEVALAMREYNPAKRKFPD
jgi:hypothetical protein